MFQKQLGTITNTLTDEEANEFSLLFEEWSPSGVYKIGDRIRYNGVLYKCLEDNNATMETPPSVIPSVWTEIFTESVSEEIPVWEQPEEGSGYADGDRVIHNDIIYISQVDNNIWEPGITGTESLWIMA